MPLSLNSTNRSTERLSLGIPPQATIGKFDVCLILGYVSREILLVKVWISGAVV
jgi:hypothetical protein